MTEPDSRVHEQVQVATRALWQRVRHTELDRASTIHTAISRLLAGRLAEDDRADAERAAHKIAGSAGMFGFSHASKIARKLELFLAAQPVDPGTAQLAADLAADLYTALTTDTDPQPRSRTAVDTGTADGADPRPVAPARGETGNPSAVLILHPQAPIAAAIAESARARGLRPQVAADPASALRVVTDHAPAAAVINFPEPGAPGQVYDLAHELDRRGTAVVGLLAQDDTTSRLAALRAGARLLLDAAPFTNIQAAQIADAVATLITDREHATPRVLAVDDDETVLLAIRQLLDPASVQVETLSDTEGFWAALSQLQPDLLLLDVDMPGASGLELCRLVRSDPRWRQLPVVFLSAGRDDAAVRRVYAVGADDFVGKPVVGPELQARIANRLERTRLHRLLAETDPLTGLANRRRLEQDLSRLQGLADRYHSTLSLAVLDVDHFKQVNDRFGHAVGDEVLRRLAAHLRAAFRGEDAVARLGGEEFVVAMLGMRREDAVERLTGVLDAFGRIPHPVAGDTVTVAVSAGVAEHRRDGTGFEALYRAADGALRTAKANGRRQVLPAGAAPPTGQGEVDVAIIEADELRAELLRHAVSTAGYRCAVLPDPARALAQLADPSAGLRPATILLSTDGPAQDGLPTLRALRNAGTAARMIVIAGPGPGGDPPPAPPPDAADCLHRPFTVAELLQRLPRPVSR